MSNRQTRKIFLDDQGDFSQQQVVRRQVVIPVRYSTDPRDIGWVRENVPCQAACPADTNIPAYIRMIVEQRCGRAYELNRIANVLPGVLGRICNRPCEPVCRHGWPGNGEPVKICHLKRAAADSKTDSHTISEELFTPTEKRIAIIGAGPAGIAAAHDLSMLGHDVTIFEREQKPGGMLRYGIPVFRLPRSILEVEIHNATRLGVDVRTGVTIGNGEGETKLSKLRKDYDAVLLTTGCMRAMRLPLSERKDEQGLIERLENCEYGLDFLLDLHRGINKSVGRRVAVIGAGFTALDCARVARRLGAEQVTIHLRTSEKYIPILEEELLEAKKEGVKILGLRTPVDIVLEEGKGCAVRFIQNRLGAWRDNGRRNAIAIPGSEFTEPFDTLLVAIGQQTLNDYLDEAVDLDRWGNVQVDKNSMTSGKGLFAAGDFVGGASTVVSAIGNAREVALKLDAWLMGRARRRKVVKVEPVTEPLRERKFDFIPRQPMPTETLANRSLEAEVETGMDSTLALEEAKRCYLCYLKYEIDVDNCIYCRACIEVAPRDCIKLVSGVEIHGDGTYGSLRETNQWNRVGAIWIDNDQCIRCGACYKVCPTHCISITRNEIMYQNV